MQRGMWCVSELSQLGIMAHEVGVGNVAGFKLGCWYVLDGIDMFVKKHTCSSYQLTSLCLSFAICRHWQNITSSTARCPHLGEITLQAMLSTATRTHHPYILSASLSWQIVSVVRFTSSKLWTCIMLGCSLIMCFPIVQSLAPPLAPLTPIPRIFPMQRPVPDHRRAV